MGFPVGLVVKNQSSNVGDESLIPKSGRSLGEGNDNSLQYSCLGNAMDSRVWQVIVHGIAESDMT